MRQCLRRPLGHQQGRLGHPQLRSQDQVRLYGSLHLNNRYLTGSATRRKTACHELGHALGHRRTGRTCMRDGFATMYGQPDATDYANLRALYRRP